MAAQSSAIAENIMPMSNRVAWLAPAVALYPTISKGLPPPLFAPAAICCAALPPGVGVDVADVEVVVDLLVAATAVGVCRACPEVDEDAVPAIPVEVAVPVDEPFAVDCEEAPDFAVDVC
jgi:hypothetical protein